MPAVRGTEIRQRRQRLGIKLGEFSELTRVKYKTVANIESGGSKVASIEVVHRFARVLGCEITDLMRDDARPDAGEPEDGTGDAGQEPERAQRPAA
jgi:transcriptional regulator with XRE-family HTH domain